MGLFDVMILFSTILIMLGFAWLCAWLAKSRGRDPIIWGIWGFFFNVLALAALLIIFRRKEGVSEQKSGISRIMKYVSVIIIAATISGVMGMVVNAAIPGPPNNILEIEPDHYWQEDATAEQLDLLRELYGTEVTAGELLEQISPQTLQKLPDTLVEPLYEKPVQWIGDSIDGPLPLVYDLIEVALNENEGDEVQETMVFFYYIGSRSQETLVVGEPVRQYRGYPDNTLIICSKDNAYRLSFYTGV